MILRLGQREPEPIILTPAAPVPPKVPASSAGDIPCTRQPRPSPTLLPWVAVRSGVIPFAATRMAASTERPTAKSNRNPNETLCTTSAVDSGEIPDPGRQACHRAHASVSGDEGPDPGQATPRSLAEASGSPFAGAIRQRSALSVSTGTAVALAPVGAEVVRSNDVCDRPLPCAGLTRYRIGPVASYFSGERRVTGDCGGYVRRGARRAPGFSRSIPPLPLHWLSLRRRL